MTLKTRIAKLPVYLKTAIKAQGYNVRDISVGIRDSASVYSPGDDGCRGFAIFADGNTKSIQKVLVGAWGGGSPCRVQSPVDSDMTRYALQDGVVLVVGQVGGRGCYATIYMNATTFESWKAWM